MKNLGLNAGRGYRGKPNIKSPITYRVWNYKGNERGGRKRIPTNAGTELHQTREIGAQKIAGTGYGEIIQPIIQKPREQKDREKKE